MTSAGKNRHKQTARAVDKRGYLKVKRTPIIPQPVNRPDAMDLDGSEDMVQHVNFFLAAYAIPFAEMYNNGSIRYPKLIAEIERFNRHYGWNELFPQNRAVDLNQTMLLILPYETIILAEQNISRYRASPDIRERVWEWYEGAFTEKLKGIAVIKTYDIPIANQRNRIIHGIFNFCKNPSELNVSNGKLLFAAVHNYLEHVEKPTGRDYYYWLQINYLASLPSPDFKTWLESNRASVDPSKLIALYGSFGFENPYISYHMPDGTLSAYGRPFLCLFKRLGEPISTNAEVVQICRHSHYLMYNSMYALWNKSTMHPIKLVFEKDVLIFLQGLLYCNLDAQIYTKNTNYEICGNMSYERILKFDPKIDGTYVRRRDLISPYSIPPVMPSTTFTWPTDNYTLNMVIKNYGNKLLDTTSDGTFPSFDGCRFEIENSYSFHTHPLAGYVDRKFSLAPPSVKDIWLVVYSVLYTEIKTICHFVITLEGIYAVSLDRPIAVPFAPGLEQKVADIVEKAITHAFDFDFEPAKNFDWTRPITECIDNINRNATDNWRSYFEHLNHQRARFVSHFVAVPWLQNIIDSVNITLYPWTKLNEVREIDVYSPMLGDPMVGSVNSCLDFDEYKTVMEIPYVRDKQYYVALPFQLHPVGETEVEYINRVFDVLDGVRVL